MSRPPTIAEVRVEDLAVPLLEPFSISLSTLHATANLLVRVVLDDGTEGIGEAAPWKELTGETQEGARAALARAGELMVGKPATGFRALSGALREALPADTSARAGAEAALLDALTRHLGLPLHAFFGGVSDAVETDLTIPIVPPARAGARASEIAADGFHAIKIKVGNDLAEDVERLAAIAAAAPRVDLIVDANQGYTVEEAMAFLMEAHARGIALALFEQPVAKDDLDGMRQIRAATEVPVAADESSATREDALEVVKHGAADLLNIKLMKCGGPVEALDIASIARAAGLGLMIGGMVETRLGMNTSLHLACGLGGFGFVDLDTHLLLAEDPFEGGFTQEGPRMAVGAAPGAGVRLR